MLPLEQEILSWIHEVWKHNEQPHSNPYNVMLVVGSTLWQKPDHVFYPALVESINRLRAKWTDEELSRHAADIYFIPELYRHYQGDLWKARVISVIATTWLHEFVMPPDILRRVEDMIVTLLHIQVYPLAERNDSLRDRAHHARNYIGLLEYVPDSPELFDLLERILRGQPLQRIESDGASVWFNPEAPTALHSTLSHISQLYRLNRVGRVDYDLFRAAIRHNTFLLDTITRVLGSQNDYVPNRFGSAKQIPGEFFDAMEPYADRLAEEIGSEITTENYLLLLRCHHLMGSKWLLRAAGQHMRQKPKVLEWQRGQSLSYIHYTDIDSLIIHLAQADLRDIDSDQKRERLVETLRGYPAPTLKALLPIARNSRDVLLAALGWENCIPLVNQMVAVSEYQTNDNAGFRFRAGDIANSSDPRSGVLDVTGVRWSIQQAGDKLTKEIFDLFGKARIGMPNTIMLFEALAGWNADKIKKAVPKRNQRYVKAFGLLPLERGEDEVLERYLFLKQYAKESKRYGPERQANERAAAAAAVANLAQIAGYDSPERLEWSMESRLAEDIAPIGRQWQVDGYTVELALDGLDPGLVISREGKSLKSVPKPLRQNPAYEEMKEAKSQLQEQFRRFRAVFEQAMAAGESFSISDLESLNRMPAARALLSRLILYTDDLLTGLYLPDQLALETLSGKVVPIQQAVRIAYPYHLFHAEELSPWQQAVVHRRIVQPFKQAFRELYLLTPAEQETRVYSQRFASHVVSGAVASRLFQARAWETANRGDSPLPRRLYRAQGVEARFRFQGVGHYFSEERAVTSGPISFHVYPNDDSYRDQEKNMLPLPDVPPLIFSEVMRDADLVVSVAHSEQWALTSSESYQRRGEVITTLLDDLGLPGVTIEDHFAYVQGKLARYRIHLGSAVIHIVPGNYLCIVPDRWGKTHERLFLPFTDTEDSKMSEVISKIFMLLADDKIKDESILRQIRRDTTSQEAS